MLVFTHGALASCALEKLALANVASANSAIANLAIAQLAVANLASAICCFRKCCFRIWGFGNLQWEAGGTREKEGWAGACTLTITVRDLFKAKLR